MNRISALLAASALVVSVSASYAGGPVVVQEEEDPAVAILPTGSGGLGSTGAIVAGVLGAAVVAAALSSGSH